MALKNSRFLILFGIESILLALPLACSLAAASENAVTLPEYVNQDERILPQAKVQYVPSTPDKPILRKMAMEGETAEGALYGSGEEMVIDPESHGLETSDAAIVDKPSAENKDESSN